MYIFFLIEFVLSNVQVLVGLANETIYISQLQIDDNSNIQNYLDNEYIALNYQIQGIQYRNLYQGLIQLKVREFREDEISYYDIWILQYYKKIHKIYKINPYLDYKDELIQEINEQDQLCMDFQITKQQLILDCSNLQKQQIIFFELNLETNQSIQHTFHYKYSLFSQRNAYFHEQFIIILVKEVESQMIYIYNRQLFVEVKSLSNTYFNLPYLKVKKIIIQNSQMVVLTECQRLFVVDLFEPFLYQQICEYILILHIQESFYNRFIVFDKYYIYLVVELQYCMIASRLIQKANFLLFEQQGQILKQKQEKILEKFKICRIFVYFSLIEQMILCMQVNSIQQVLLTQQQFSKVLITNNFYLTKKGKTLILRVLKPKEIEYIDIQEDFFPLLFVQSEQIVMIQYNSPFYGPNITYTFKSKEFVEISNQLIIDQEQSDIQCYFYDFYRLLEQYNNYAHLCQFENKTISISSVEINYSSTNKKIKFYYLIDFYLNESFLLITADSGKLRIIQMNTQQIYEFAQMDQSLNNSSLTAFYFNTFYFQLLNDTIMQFQQQIEIDIKFNFALDNIKSLGIDQIVNFIYSSTDNQYLFLGTENYVIIFYILPVQQQQVKFQLVQVFENQLQIKQVYLSAQVLYLIFSDFGYLKILKYQQLQLLHFTYLGEVDCLGYKVKDFELNRNGAIDYYFINSYQDILIFELSNSLQNSFIRIIENSRFIRSLDNKFCLQQIFKISCQSICKDQLQLQLDLDLINNSKSIPYEVCASNLNSIKCLNQNLKVVVNYQALKLHKYYLTHIDQNIYQINFDIQQGFINTIEGDTNVEFIQPIKLILNHTNNIMQISENEDYIIMNSQKGVIFYNKLLKQFHQLNDVCVQSFLIQNHLICYLSYILMTIYDCKDVYNCILLNQILINNRVLMYVRYSGNFILLKYDQNIEIAHYKPENGLIRRIILLDIFQMEIIHQIQGSDFWLICLNKQKLYLFKYVQFQQQLNQTIKIYEQFNQDQQYTSKNDQILEILVLEQNQNSITLLFLMKLSTHKAYKFSLLKEVINIQCIFELLFYRLHNNNQKYRYSLNNELLMIQIEQEKLGVYNVSLNQKEFLRNMLFVIETKFITSISLMRNIHHFIHQNQIFLFISQNQKLYLFELNLNYQIRILDVKKESILTLNKEKENIQIIISQKVDTDYYQNHKIVIFITVILIILYIFRRQFIKMNT